MELTGSFSYIHNNYYHSEGYSYTAESDQHRRNRCSEENISDQRIDDVIFLSIGIGRNMYSNFRIDVEFQYTDNNSTLKDQFDFDRNLVSINFTARI